MICWWSEYFNNLNCRDDRKAEGSCLRREYEKGDRTDVDDSENVMKALKKM